MMSFGLPGVTMAGVTFFASLMLISVVSVMSQDGATLVYTIQENNPANQELGNIVLDAQLDQRYPSDVLQTLRFQFLSSSPDLFAIDQNTGILTAPEPIDREEICPGEEVCSVLLDITAQSGTDFEFIKVSVTIEDVNDNTPTFSSSPIERYISEASVPGASLNLPKASDNDSPHFGIQGYQVVGGTGTDTFELQLTDIADGTQRLELVQIDELDRETVEYYQIIIRAYDGGNPARTGLLTVNIQVLDVNDNSPHFDNQTYTVSISENVQPYTSVIQVQATDPDAGESGEIVYSLTEDTQQSVGNIFEIDETSGEIYTKIMLDYEAGSLYKLEISARDRSPDSIPSLAKVNIYVTDLNDHAPQITINSDTPGVVTVSESARIGGFVAHITVVDLDDGVNGQFTCVLDNAVNFELEQLYATEYKIVTKTQLDREVQSQYELGFICEDEGSPQLISTEYITVMVGDENDHEPVFSPLYHEVTIMENNPAGAPLITVTASDDDIDENGRIVYSIDPSYLSLFDVNADTGALSARTSLDHEIGAFYSFLIYGEDQGDPSYTASATVLVAVADRDDNPAQFDQYPFVLDVPENQPAGTRVDRINATDPDETPFNTFTYSIDPAYNVENAFSIDTTTGVITTTKVLDREVQSVYHIIVVATGPEPNRMENRTNVFISVTDQNDNDPVFMFPSVNNNTVSVPQDRLIGHIVTRLIVLDNDTDENARIMYNITAGDDNGYFSIDQVTGEVIVEHSLSDLADSTVTLTILASDHGDPPRIDETILNIYINQSGTGTLLSNKNLNIVIIIASISGILIIILILSILFIVVKQRDSDRKKYNYVPRLADKKDLQRKEEEQLKAMANGHLQNANKSISKEPLTSADVLYTKAGEKLSFSNAAIDQKDYLNSTELEGATMYCDDRESLPDLELGEHSMYPDVDAMVPKVWVVDTEGVCPESYMTYPTYPLDPMERFLNYPPDPMERFLTYPPEPKLLFPDPYVVPGIDPVDADMVIPPCDRPGVDDRWPYFPDYDWGPLDFEKPQLTTVDSDSACSADVSNADSGRGSNDDGSDQPARASSPQEGASPPISPMKVKPPPLPAKAPIMTRSLPQGVHQTRGPRLSDASRSDSYSTRGDISQEMNPYLPHNDLNPYISHRDMSRDSNPYHTHRELDPRAPSRGDFDPRSHSRDVHNRSWDQPPHPHPRDSHGHHSRDGYPVTRNHSYRDVSPRGREPPPREPHHHHRNIPHLPPRRTSSQKSDYSSHERGHHHPKLPPRGRPGYSDWQPSQSAPAVSSVPNHQMSDSDKWYLAGDNGGYPSSTSSNV